MLCVSRKVGERIIIDLSKITPDQLLTMQQQGAAVIRVLLVSTKGESAKLGVDACPFIPVPREEVHERNKERSK